MIIAHPHPSAFALDGSGLPFSSQFSQEICGRGQEKVGGRR